MELRSATKRVADSNFIELDTQIGREAHPDKVSIEPRMGGLDNLTRCV